MGPTSCKTKFTTNGSVWALGKWREPELGDIAARICEWVPKFTPPDTADRNRCANVLTS
jgi:hypothetical protein